jgi:chromosome segregation ATPase
VAAQLQQTAAALQQSETRGAEESARLEAELSAARASLSQLQSALASTEEQLKKEKEIGGEMMRDVEGLKGEARRLAGELEAEKRDKEALLDHVDAVSCAAIKMNDLVMC